ncbi:sensor histidine kinase [Mucilaginibacter psychrotolerans]|uniref:Histidine kinase n=1 Tax=Mucilaginibacter psychrotolerans TaxID=1524096 RepID=A0A4Y8S3W0_9SPHI|nr:sensor histidine kinase [Mucilaginibacter psychrotolerans]TFF33639.1 histidine kinase [Mucilaginibacter psychrotolerans]
MMKRGAIWLVHTGYWLLFAVLLLAFFFFAVFVPAHVPAGTHPLNSLAWWLRLMAGFAVLPGVLSFYACYTYLFDNFLSRQRFLLFLAASILAACLSSIIGAALASLPFLFGPMFLFGDGYASALFILLLMAAIAWVNGMMGAIIKGCLTWYRDIRLKEELHRKNVETELALVKAQIDPHFLFNTLNNIDILINLDTAAASAYLNKLSAIMRFLLYETKRDRIALERELEYLQQYIDLQRIRTSNASYVDLELEGEFSGQMIAPMILLPFIENAFKHTEDHKADSSINIHLQSRKNQLVFTCINTLHSKAETGAHTGGLGNSLIRKRLQLLYPGAHNLTITGEASLYRVKLELSL